MMIAGGIDWAAAQRRVVEGQNALAGLLEVGGDRLEILLRERARQLAQPGKDAVRRPDAIRVLVGRVGGERYGLALTKLAGVLPFKSCTPVAGGPSELLGVINVRGEIWSAFELRRLVGGAPAEMPAGGHIVLLRHGRRRVALRIDEAERVRDVARTELKLPTNEASRMPSELIIGLTSDSMILFDPDALWTHPAMTEQT
jgi:purine-binding chemotaxis protein CheW